MYARITKLRVDIDKVSEATKLYEESVYPVVKSQKGCCGGYFLTDEKTGKITAIALWNTEDDAKENEESGFYEEQVNKFKHLIIEPPVKEGYEVKVKI